MNKVSWTIFGIVTISILGLLVFFSNSDSTPEIDVSKIDVTAIQKGNSQNGNIADHIYGKEGSKVTLIEYADYQCPGCGGIQPVIKSITEEYKDQIQYVYRNFLLSYHNNTKAAAGAAEAAGLQGKYWEMHNLIFESQDEWNTLTGQDRTDKFLGYAKKISLDTNIFLTDMSSDEIIAKINYDYALGKKAGVEATPSFYLNGVNISSDIWEDETKFKSAIDAELKKNGIPLPSEE